MASATHFPLVAATQPMEVSKRPELRTRLVLEKAAAYGLAALTAAFGDNPLGLVFDYTWTGKGIKVIDVLQGGPGFRAGLKPGDVILRFYQHALGNWTDSLSLPAYLTVKRDGLPLEMVVR
jgi:predicted metalloprotease with PDZ domain